MSGRPHLSVASNADIHKKCCDLLLEGETGWIRRRKETASLITETRLHHRLSLDFLVAGLPTTRVGQTDMIFVPLTLLRKEPGTFTQFDLTDETGRSLPLPGRDRNAEISAGVLYQAAQKVLGEPISATLRAELGLIARAAKDNALQIVTGAYQSPEGALVKDTEAPVRRRLWRDARFRWLLVTLAQASVVVAVLPSDDRPRRIVKLSFDERISEVTELGQRGIRARLDAWAYRLGWKGYLLQVHSPFVGAASYHFELHAPDGTELLAAGLEPPPSTANGTGPHDSRRVHLYLDDARDRRSSVAWAQFRIRGPGFVGAAAMTCLAITLSLAAAAYEAPKLVDTATSGPALLLLFPGLVGSYLARPTHPLVSRLLDLARWALILCTVIAYVAAGRLAIVSQAHASSAHSLRWFFGAAACCALVLTIALLVSWRMPRPIKSPAAD